MRYFRLWVLNYSIQGRYLDHVNFAVVLTPPSENHLHGQLKLARGDPEISYEELESLS